MLASVDVHGPRVNKAWPHTAAIALTTSTVTLSLASFQELYPCCSVCMATLTQDPHQRGRLNSVLLAAQSGSAVPGGAHQDGGGVHGGHPLPGAGCGAGQAAHHPPPRPQPRRLGEKHERKWRSELLVCVSTTGQGCRGPRASTVHLPLSVIFVRAMLLGVLH